MVTYLLTTHAFITALFAHPQEATAVPQPAQVEAPAPAPMEIVEDQAPVAMLPVGVEDIDEQDAYNTQMATEYVTEIYTYMRELEVSG